MEALLLRDPRIEPADRESPRPDARATPSIPAALPTQPGPPAAWGVEEWVCWMGAAPCGARREFHRAAAGRSLALDRREDAWLDALAALLRPITRQRRAVAAEGGGWIYWAEVR